MASKFLLVGLASDGPQNQVVYPASLGDLNTLYGNTFIQRQTISSSASSIILNYDVVSKPANTVDSRKNRLFAPYYQDGYYYFGTQGGTGTFVVDLEYTPYVGQEDLLCAATRFYTLTGEMPYVCRVGGNTGSLMVEDWSFYAISPGKKYNAVSVTMTSSSLTVSGLEPNFTTRTYVVTGTAGISNCRQSLDRDFRLGLIPIYASAVGSALVAGTYTVTGGLDGAFTDQSVEDFIENIHIPPEVSHIVFLRSINDIIMDYLIDHFAQFSTQPRMFLFNAPNYTGTIEDWAVEQVTEVPNRHDQVAAVLGTIQTNYKGKDVTRYAVEGLACGLARKATRNPTNTPISANSYAPILTEDELDAVKGFGWMALNRFIKNDIGLYQGVTTANQNTFLYTSKTAEIASVAYNFCSVYYGQVLNSGPRADIANSLKALLDREISFVTIQTVDVLVKGDSIYIDILAYLPGEILKISFSIKNR